MSDNYQLDTTVKHASNDSIDTVHNLDLDLKASHIYLTGNADYIAGTGESSNEPGVEFSMATRFIKNMNILMRARPDTPILIHMKTCGGDWTEGMAIYDMIKSCPSPVTILSYTHARSMSSLIFQAANKRVMMPTSYFMLHDGTYGDEGTVKQVKSNLEFHLKASEKMLDIYVAAMKEKGKFSHKSPVAIRKMLRDLMDKKEDVYLTAEEAVEWGLADEIFGVTMPYNWGNLLDYSDEELSR